MSAIVLNPATEQLPWCPECQTYHHLQQPCVALGPDHSEPAFMGIDATIIRAFDELCAGIDQTGGACGLCVNGLTCYDHDDIPIRNSYITGYVYREPDGPAWVGELYADGDEPEAQILFDRASHAEAWLISHGANEIRYALSQKDEVEEACASMYADVFSFPNVTIEYTNRNGQAVRWNPLAGYYFVIFDKCPNLGSNLRLLLELGLVSNEYHTLYGAKSHLLGQRAVYRDYDWSKTNPRIVKANSAFDAHEFGIEVYTREITPEYRAEMPLPAIAGPSGILGHPGKLLAVAALLLGTLCPLGHAQDVVKPIPVTEHGTVVSETRLHRLYGEYTIATPTMRYDVEEKLIPLTAPAHITVGGTVAFKLTGPKMKITDNDGREHTATIIHQEIRGTEKGGLD